MTIAKRLGSYDSFSRDEEKLSSKFRFPQTHAHITSRTKKLNPCQLVEK